MTHEEFYGEALPLLKSAEAHILSLLSDYPGYKESDEGLQELLYFRSRIKSPESMIKKLEKKKLPADVNSALYRVHDAVGIRAVCAFTDDVYRLKDWLLSKPELKLSEEKDYISYPKDNGYRSLHLIVDIISGAGRGLAVEIQLRTIATDFWAALEHQMKYKRDVNDGDLIVGELKRCADEIASVDLSMQTLRDIIKGQKD